MGTIAIPVLPEILDALNTDKKLNYDEKDIADVTSGMFMIAGALGDTIGPACGSVVSKVITFKKGMDLTGNTLLAFGLLYLISTYFLC